MLVLSLQNAVGGVLLDTLLQNQTAGHLREVAAPKVSGSFNLHELAARTRIQSFALFSSIAALLGNKAQANYASANKIMDAFASNQAAKVSIKITPATAMHISVKASMESYWPTSEFSLLGPNLMNILGLPNAACIGSQKNDIGKDRMFYALKVKPATHSILLSGRSRKHV